MDKKSDSSSVRSLNLQKPDAVLFSFQVISVFLVICVSLLNLTMQWGNINLWTVILTGSLGYILPNPKLKPDIESFDIEVKKLKTENL